MGTPARVLITLMRKMIVPILAFTLAACGMGKPSMSEREAFASLRNLARDSASICETEGRRTLRQSARAYAYAQREKGALWPSIEAVSGARPDSDAQRIEVFVIGSMMFGLVEPGELGGDAQRIRRSVERDLPGGLALRDFKAAGHPSCGQVIGAYADVVKFSFEQQRLDERIARARRDGDRHSVSRLVQSRSRLNDRMARRSEQLRVAIEQLRS
jgi:hypothetical protein